ncbi:MAG: 50S ribosomal protein L6 [Nanohaloarchaea archaeon]|nr:50S ribosomal protein L6 [Candidatus Nanohaloarchaea archaeon]
MRETADLNGFEANYEDGVLEVEGNGETVSRKLNHARIDVEVKDGEVVFSSDESNKTVKSILGTFRSHVQNMVDGLEDEHVYQMKGVYAHFPMDIDVENDQVVIGNFMGERNPRKVDIAEGAEVSVNGEDLEIRGADKEAVGLTAGRIEQACKKGNRDPRTFQDGVYITDKGEKE